MQHNTPERLHIAKHQEFRLSCGTLVNYLELVEEIPFPRQAQLILVNPMPADAAAGFPPLSHVDQNCLHGQATSFSGLSLSHSEFGSSQNDTPSGYDVFAPEDNDMVSGTFNRDGSRYG